MNTNVKREGEGDGEGDPLEAGQSTASSLRLKPKQSYGTRGAFSEGTGLTGPQSSGITVLTQNPTMPHQTKRTSLLSSVNDHAAPPRTHRRKVYTGLDIEL